MPFLLAPNHIVGNTADSKGIGTEGKSLTFNKAKEVWGNQELSEAQYKELTGNTAQLLSDLFHSVVNHEKNLG